MLQFICLFFPPVIAVQSSLKGSENLIIQSFQFLYLYCKWTLVVLFLSYCSLYVFSSNRGLTIFPDQVYVSFLLKYLLISTMIALILPKLENVAKKNISFKVKIKRK